MGGEQKSLLAINKCLNQLLLENSLLLSILGRGYKKALGLYCSARL